ncbi:hypothetical protein J6590_079037 [Homalodisca vitripennis]|nr:hypothetical protein J6590_079037 [Homalodisca vitripennis]
MRESRESEMVEEYVAVTRGKTAEMESTFDEAKGYVWKRKRLMVKSSDCRLFCTLVPHVQSRPHPPRRTQVCPVTSDNGH